MISVEFLACLVDCIAPGGEVREGVVLPSAGSVGCNHIVAEAMAINPSLRELGDAIVARAGAEETFSATDPQKRNILLKAIQGENPERFASLVTLVLGHYYAQSQVLNALNWPVRPPQPNGHELPPFDESLLAPVRARGQIWRQC